MLTDLPKNEIRIQVAPEDYPSELPSYVVGYRISECTTDYPYQNYTITLELGTKVPDLKGLPRDDAETALADSRFGADPQPGDAGADWTVTDQNPPAGDLVRYDSPIRFDLVPPRTPTPEVSPPSPPPVSPRPSLVKVPKLEGLDPTKAEQRLTKAGLLIRLAPGSPLTGKISRQDPAAGAEVAKLTTVTVWLTRAPKPDGEGGETGPTDGSTTEAGAGSELVPVALALAVLAALSLGLVSLVRAKRRRKAPQRRKAPRRGGSIHCVAYPDPAPDVELHLAPSTPSVGLPDIWVEAYPDPGRQELREVVP
ncbi:PASTA domain-containing protein [Sphaerisporangium sp. NPDC088356]|uniref:PASTA domain-containing protein n=1 Tax=Sphaerisporangium sp. NPDC088356 TaxID=3154871 RepID=UPI0034309BD5